MIRQLSICYVFTHFTTRTFILLHLLLNFRSCNFSAISPLFSYEFNFQGELMTLNLHREINEARWSGELFGKWMKHGDLAFLFLFYICIKKEHASESSFCTPSSVLNGGHIGRENLSGMGRYIKDISGIFSKIGYQNRTINIHIFLS